MNVYIGQTQKMNIHIVQKTNNERLYRSNIQKMNVYIGRTQKMNGYIGQNTKNERLYRAKPKK